MFKRTEISPNLQAKKKILFISNSGGVGGAQLCLLELIKNLPNNYLPIVLIPKQGKFANILAENKIVCLIVPFRGWWYSRFRIKLLERVFNNFLALIVILYKLRRLKLSLIYSNTLYSPIGGVISNFLKIPHIWHIHEFTHLNKIQYFDFGIKKSMNFVNRSTNAVICPSFALRTDLLNFIDGNKLNCIPNGIDLNFPLNGEIVRRIDSSFKILIIGSINEFKGQKYAIYALNQLRKFGRDVRLTIVGEGSYSDVLELKNLSIKLGVSEFISWEGHQDNVFKYLVCSDVLYVCSEFESFGKVILEAMLFKCPVIATNTGGIPEIIEDGKNGFLFSVGDIVTLVDKTIFLMDNFDVYCRIQINGFDSCNENYGVDKYVNSIETLIENFSI